MLIKQKCNSNYLPLKNKKNLGEITKQADILVAAIGKPKFVTADMVKRRRSGNRCGNKQK